VVEATFPRKLARQLLECRKKWRPPLYGSAQSFE